jgi:hypothetical protein
VEKIQGIEIQVKVPEKIMKKDEFLPLKIREIKGW